MQLDLVMHTAVDYIALRGAGIGVVQRAECPSTGAIRNDRIPGQEQKHSYSRHDLVVNNIKTKTRAHMLAMIHALGLAYRTIKRYPKALQRRKVTILSDLPDTVKIVNHHISQHKSPQTDSLRNMASTKDRSLLQKIITRVRKLSHSSITVAIVASYRRDKAGRRARTLAKQSGRKSLKIRRGSQFVNSPPEAEEADYLSEVEETEEAKEGIELTKPPNLLLKVETDE